MTITMTLDEYERRAVVSGLRRLRNNILQLQRRDRDTGWTPEPGRENIHDLRLATVDRLLARLMIDREQVELQV